MEWKERKIHRDGEALESEQGGTFARGRRRSLIFREGGMKRDRERPWKGAGWAEMDDEDRELVLSRRQMLMDEKMMYDQSWREVKK